MARKHRSLLGCALLLAFGCSSSPNPTSASSGSANGGSNISSSITGGNANGGASETSGSNAAGGITGVGGAITGGAVAIGGAYNTGGTKATGASTTASVGGNNPIGGTTATVGTGPTGGSTGTGGTTDATCMDAGTDASQTTTQVIGIGGGTISVENDAGDTLTLQIPPLALGEDTCISISALPSAPPSPIGNIIYPGAVFEPSGLVFSLPVTVTVVLHGPLVSPGALLSYLNASDYALPIANQTVLTAQNGIQGEIYHFSPPLSVAIPSLNEIQSMDSKIMSLPYTTPEDLLDRANSLLALGKEMDILGYDVASLDPVADAQALLEDGIAKIVNSPLPDEPCGKNTLIMGRLFKLIDILGLAQSVDEPLLQRMCTFSLAPNPLSLYLGGSSPQTITASLVDPNGQPRSCSVIRWFSSNLNVVDIAANGMACVPTAVGQGIVEVSANCEGQLASTQVSVCSLNGTWQGPYSGQTISCAARDSNGVCVQWGGLKDFSGTAAIPLTQSGTNVTAVIQGFTFAGTNIDGAVNLTAVLPCNGSTSTCPGQVSGTLAPDCSTFSGNLSDARARTIAGTFTLYPPAAQ